MAYNYRNLFKCSSMVEKKLQRISIISFCRKFCLKKALYSKQNVTIQLLPEVEKLLDSGDIKHRKHPGIQKKTPVVLPEVLKNAVDKIISYQSEKVLLLEAEALNKFLKSRKLPAEAEEINRKIHSMMPSSGAGDYEDFFERLNKYELKVLKRRIRSEIGKWKPIEYNQHECLAYLVGRLSANYASTSFVFQQLQKSFPAFKPTSYFDFGSGVGSALWAAHSFWSDSIKEYFCVDASAEMNDLCQDILTDESTEQKHIEPVFFRQFLPASETIKYDLVVSAFSLMDLPTFADRLRVVDTLWRKTKEYLIFIEYGSTAGFKSVLDARDFILHVENDSNPEFACYNSGAYVVSPCPHDSPCPKIMENNSATCAFTVPYQILFPFRLRQSTAKDWISYVILKKGPRQNENVVHPRIVKPVLKKCRHVHCRLCCPDGKLHEIIVTKAKHGRHTYRCARESSEGDILPVNLLTVQNEIIEN